MSSVLNTCMRCRSLRRKLILEFLGRAEAWWEKSVFFFFCIYLFIFLYKYIWTQEIPATTPYIFLGVFNLKKAEATSAARLIASRRPRKECKQRSESLRRGYKIWSAKRKLNYEDRCKENESPPKRVLRHQGHLR